MASERTRQDMINKFESRYTDDYVDDDRIVDAAAHDEDSELDFGLRPQTLEEYVGQEKAKESLKIYIEAAKMRGEALDHVLLYALPGWAKRRFPPSSPMSLASISALPPVPPLRSRGTLRRC